MIWKSLPPLSVTAPDQVVGAPAYFCVPSHASRLSAQATDERQCSLLDGIWYAIHRDFPDHSSVGGRSGMTSGIRIPGRNWYRCFDARWRNHKIKATRDKLRG